ncbi:DUF6153 family protein [Gordonia polyisoprenivorans]|uniref:DUF6153 family protein n=1 Tax=Gordonia polyisoprenivorans TaxID=84595 RepID=UPI001AD62E93|nr:DUF6153 family protein [Gordonia polyisoprenivorans]QTI70070.1 hypothetical protein J6U32_05675 [Gordonia polyisoprenivorans]
MRAPRIDHRQWLLRVCVIGLLAIAVLLMHSLVAGTPREAHAATHHSAEHYGTEHHSAATMTDAADPEVSHMSDAGDCVLGHHCVFVRADDAPLPPIILLVLVWGFAALPALVGIAPALLGHLGRPPPWAQPTHLSLSVIRC